MRADSLQAGRARIRENLKHYRCWQEDMAQYLFPVIGDLSSPEVRAVPMKKWQELSERMEVVYHNGAVLNFVYPYEFLKATNVGGTTETLRLACSGQPKYYHYVSSYSVYDTPCQPREARDGRRSPDRMARLHPCLTPRPNGYRRNWWALPASGA